MRTIRGKVIDPTLDCQHLVVYEGDWGQPSLNNLLQEFEDKVVEITIKEIVKCEPDSKP